MGIIVIKRDGTEESFDVDKISASIMLPAIEVGGEDYELADELAYKIEDMLEANGIDEISSEDLEVMVRDLLINEGHAKTATRYIVFAADRNKQREMNTELMKSFEDITFSSGEDSDLKRENANINSETSMGTMLKYGSEGAKKFNLMYLISPHISRAHKSGDIHIHDLDFYALTETCIGYDSLITLRIKGKELVLKVGDFANYLGLVDVDKWMQVEDVEILSNGRFVKLKSIVKHSSDGKRMLSIHTPTGDLNVTDEHTVSTVKTTNGKTTVVDKKASDISAGDILSINSICADRYNLKTIDIINEYNGDNLVIYNSDDVLRNVKKCGNWKEFCNIFDYRDSRAELIRSGHSKMTIQEFKLIEHLSNIKHSDLKIQYKRSRSDETINAVIELSYELGNIIGLMFAEGSITEHTDKGQDSPVKKACFCNYDEDLIAQFNDNYRKVFNNAKITDRKHKGRHTGSILSGYLQHELFHSVFGCKYSVDNIELANWMYMANKDFVSGFIGGLIDGDGCVQKDGYRVQVTSVSRNMLKSVQKLLLMRGITTNLKHKGIKDTEAHFRNSNNEEVTSLRNHDIYRMEITGDLYNKLGWVNSNKIKDVGLRDSNKFPYKNIEVTSIEEIEYSGFVFDMETEDSHFNVDGFNVHNCMQIPLDKLFKDGFNTGHGFLREPGNIRTAGALAAIAIQSNQNDQHGGQSIPLFDYYLAPYVALSYVKHLAHNVRNRLDLTSEQYKELKERLVEYQKKHTLVINDACKKELTQMVREFLDNEGVKYRVKDITKTFENAYNDTYDETFQAMEAFIHNLNTMHSRAGRCTKKVNVPVTWETLCPAV